MKVLNIMLSRSLGGIQQAFLDYNDALKLKEFEVVNITSLFAKVNRFVPKTISLPNLGPYDIFSRLYLKLIIRLTKPDLIIAHGNRAIEFAKNTRPIIGVAHNYNLKYLRRCHYVIALTEHMKGYLVENGFDNREISVIPNMIHISRDYVLKTYRTPLVIGVVARFVEKKGIDIFLKALAILKDQGYIFIAMIGGDGEEKDSLMKLSTYLSLEENVNFVGWIEDTHHFFNSIDIFCLPSTHEPFGIIVLEAMACSTPIVATKTEGPLEILEDKENGLLCEIDSAIDLSKKLALMIDNQAMAQKYAKSGYLRLKENYDINVIAQKLSYFLKSINKNDL